MTKREIAEISGLTGVIGASVVTILWVVLSSFTPPAAPPVSAMAPPVVVQAGPPTELMGWAGEEAAKDARKLMGDEAPPELTVVAAVVQAADGRCIRLWDFSKTLNGQHIPTYRQQVGDCVSFGTGNALMYSAATSIVLGRTDAKFQEIYQPYIYGISRVQIGGGRIGGDGSTGAWAAKGVEQYGVLSREAQNCPDYSGSVARQWGSRGPPANFIDIAKKYKAEARLVATWDQLVQAISQGYGVAVCSGQGFAQPIEKNGRLESAPRGSWAHCMAIIAFDERDGREAAYILNSWGESAHGRPEDYKRLDGAPPGGFWAQKSVVERMLRQRDTYAYSWDGFKGEPLFPVGETK